jgi:hypothetical protein
MLDRVVVDEPIEVLRQRAGHSGWLAGAWAVGETLHSLVGKAVDPFAQRRIGSVRCERRC